MAASLSESFVESIETFSSFGQQFFIAHALPGPAVEQSVDPNALDSLKLSILEVRIVDHFCHPVHGGVIDAESLDQRFESAVVAVMREFHSHHVERNGGRVPFWISTENKLCLSIDESPDKPR